MAKHRATARRAGLIWLAWCRVIEGTTTMNKGEILGLADRDRRTLSDPQRLLWRDDVEGICPTPDVCWEYGDIARCGPCAIKQAEKFGIESNHALPNLPDVYRLRRANTQAADEIARLREALERQCDNMAFTLNKATLPDQWYSKFSNELEQDRAALQHKEPQG